MFSFPWVSTVRNEKAFPGKSACMPTSTPLAPTLVHNEAKRKREDEVPVASSHIPFPAPKRIGITSSTRLPFTTAEQYPMPAKAVEAIGGSTSGTHGWTQSQEPTGSAGTTLLNTLAICQTSRDQRVQDVRHDDFIPCSSPNSASSLALRNTIEAQFGLEILLKHKELRLIDQEFAKCQIALEQLRRCQVVPYPAMSSEAGAVQAASSGSGAAFNSRTSNAPPWGVIDGPYSRHYQRWLIPDRVFDDTIQEDVRTPAPAGKRMPERATRGSKYDTAAAAGNARSQRGSNNTRLKALPHGYPEPKEEKGPMIVKRGSDGKMVKLVCLDCRRSNFNSAQGFINHCRIAHSRQFLSHDAAIEASGEEIDVNGESGMGEVNSVPQVTASSALVHPLIRSSAHLARTASFEPSVSSSTKQKRSQASSSTENPTIALKAQGDMPTLHQMKLASLADSAPFTPSPQAPHLSALFVKLGRGGDLDNLVKEAKAIPDVDLSLSSDDDDEDFMEVAAGTTNAAQSRSTRGVPRGSHLSGQQARSPTPSQQSPSQQSFHNGSRKPPRFSNINIHQTYPSPYHSGGLKDPSVSIDESSSIYNLSPNNTEAHTAPSLVSDDGDFENTHSESESPSSAEADDDEDHYIHAELMDNDNMELSESTSAAHHIGLGGKPQAPAVRRRSSAIRTPLEVPNAEAGQRHVSFASPARRPKRDSQSTIEK